MYHFCVFWMLFLLTDIEHIRLEICTKICTICCYCSIITKNEECQQTALLWESVDSQVTRLQAVWSGVQSSVWARYFSPFQSTHAPFSVGASSPEERHPRVWSWPLTSVWCWGSRWLQLYFYSSPPPHMPTRANLLVPSAGDKIVWESVQHFSSYLQIQIDRHDVHICKFAFAGFVSTHAKNILKGMFCSSAVIYIVFIHLSFKIYCL
jgi:hypothetical protein